MNHNCPLMKEQIGTPMRGRVYTLTTLDAEANMDIIQMLPLDHEIEFSIDLQLGTQLISVTPYRLVRVEIEELKK